MNIHQLNDNDNELGEVAIRDALLVYQLRPDATYANTVMTVAKRYGYSEIYVEYEEIFNNYMKLYEGKEGIG